MKTKKPKPKTARAVRISDSTWAKVQEVALRREMRPSEYIRRIIEDSLGLSHAPRR